LLLAIQVVLRCSGSIVLRKIEGFILSTGHKSTIFLYKEILLSIDAEFEKKSIGALERLI